MVVSILSGASSRRTLAHLSNLTCPLCGKSLGNVAAVSAQEAYSRRCWETRQANPGYRINFVREWDVVCPHGQSTSYFQFEKLELYMQSFNERHRITGEYSDAQAESERCR